MAAAPVVLGAVGFTAAGITAGSYAASLMSAAAIAERRWGGSGQYGGLVAVSRSVSALGTNIHIYISS